MRRFVRLHISCETAAQLLNGDKSERERREREPARSERSVCPLIRSTPLSFPNYHRLPAPPMQQGAAPLFFVVDPVPLLRHHLLKMLFCKSKSILWVLPSSLISFTLYHFIVQRSGAVDPAARSVCAAPPHYRCRSQW